MLFFLLPLLANAAAVQDAPARLQHHKRDDLAISVSGSPTQCGELDVTVTGGQTPYSVSVQDPNGGTSLLVLPPATQEGLFHWTVDVAGGQGIVLRVDDVAKGSAQTPSMNVASSSDRSCLPGGVSDIGGQDSIFVWVSSVAPPAGGGSGGAGSTTGGSGATSSGSGGSGATPTSSGSGSNPTGGASSGSPTVSGTDTAQSTVTVTPTAAPTSDGTGAGSLSAPISTLALLGGLLAALL